ncbi:hypothetical protein NLJ89_g8982 [Agrocybe chaxingu]|uniref:DUF6533 domain-containing protein n=1 Tax=Agrocybe chaxingu TaxID=84603 RepID=A0A9W8JUE9_9AGAR|nr:hypothetical protein NLJ89_g8982 [Agrocybe chaxingu]
MAVIVAATVIFLWDYLLTFGMEVRYIWPGKWTFVKIVFLVQRYVPFLDIMWYGMHVSFGSNLSTKFCTRVNYVGKGLMLLGLISSEIVLLFRIWAVWNRNQIMTILLPVLFAACWIPPTIFLVEFIRSVKFVAVEPPFLGCVVLSASDVITLSWIFMLIWDTVSLILMVIPAVRACSYRGHSTLFRTVYGEGIVYYFYLFVLSTINILLNFNPSIAVPYRFLAVQMSRSLHSILTSRVLLHIRAQTDRTEVHGPSSFQFSDEEALNGRHRTPVRLPRIVFKSPTRTDYWAP